MPRQHKPSCAKRLREQAATEEWTAEQTVARIVECCAVTRLRAQRLARGWTLKIAVTRFHEMCVGAGVAAPRVDEDQLGVWETRPERSPRARTIDLLCRLYQTDAQGLGFAGSYRDSTQEVATNLPTAAACRPSQVTRGTANGQVAAGGASLEESVEAARQSVDRTLASASVTTGQLDLLDERLLWLRQEYLHQPPRPMTKLLLEELAEVHALASDRQPAAVQTRLSEMTALLATLVADALMKLGLLRQSHAWYATARTAADDSGNTGIRARVRAQAAMLPYYYGPLEAAVTLAREARLLAVQRPTATGAFAAAAEARALARQGDPRGALHAVAIARDTFERCEHGREDDAFAFPERRLLLYLSGAHTFLGQSRRARDVQQQALRLYPSETGIDPALLRLEEAICLSRERSLSEACQLAGETYLHVPADHRTPILCARAQHVIDSLPPALRTARAARQLDEILALPTGTV